MIRLLSLFVVAAIFFSLTSCVPATKPSKNKSVKKKEGPTKKGIFGKKTQDVGKYDPNAGYVLLTSEVKVTNPLTAGLEAYGPLAQRSAELGVKHSIDLYEAEHGHYPTYEEFMKDIVVGPKLPLPVLPNKAKYMYDEANHKLVVIENPDKKKEDEK